MSVIACYRQLTIRSPLEAQLKLIGVAQEKAASCRITPLPVPSRRFPWHAGGHTSLREVREGFHPGYERWLDDADELAGGLLVLTVANLLTQGDFIRPRESGGSGNGGLGGGLPVPADENSLTSWTKV